MGTDDRRSPDARERGMSEESGRLDCVRRVGMPLADGAIRDPAPGQRSGGQRPPEARSPAVLSQRMAPA